MVQSESDLKSDPPPPRAGRIPISAKLSSTILLFSCCTVHIGPDSVIILALIGTLDEPRERDTPAMRYSLGSEPSAA